MSKHLLLDDFEYEYKLIGISSHAPDYRLSWAINQVLGIQLVKSKEVELYKKGKQIPFGCFQYFPENSEKEYRLIANKNKKVILVPEQKQADFFLHLYDISDEEFQEILAKIKRINIILICFEINVANLKSKQNLVF